MGGHEGDEGHEGREREREGHEGDEGHEGRECEREGHEGDEGHEVSWRGVIGAWAWLRRVVGSTSLLSVGLQVIRNIVVCTTAGTTAEWWFARRSPVHPTWAA